MLLYAFVCFGVEFVVISAAVLLPVGGHLLTSGALLEGSGLYILHAFLLAFVCQLCMYYAELYDFRVPLSNGKLFMRLLESLGAATIALVVFFYFVPSLEIEGSPLLLSLLRIFCALAGWRLFYQWVLSVQQFRVNVLIIGTGEEAQRLAGELLKNQSLGYNVRGFVGEKHEVGKDML